MFTPGEIEAIPIGAEHLFNDLENRIMADIVRRLKNNSGEIIRSADWLINRMYELGISRQEIKERIQKALKLTDDEIDNIYDEVIKSGYARDEKIYKACGKDFIPYDENLELQQLVQAVSDQTKQEFRNITQSLGFAVQGADGKLSYLPIAKFYQKTLDDAMMDITTGTFDYNTVLKRTIQTMTNSGLRWIDYASGRHNRVEVAARRAVLTGFNQVVAQVNERNAEELDTTYFEVSYHGGARPSHQVWQGRVYTKKQLESVCGLGTVTGLCGANCYHSYSPFFPGISKRQYTDAELGRMNAEENTPKEYNGKQYTKYEALQKQRRMETVMRAQRQKIKLLEDGGADEDDIIAARCRYRGTSAEYARFSKAMNLKQQRDRVTVDGLGNIGVGKWKVDLTDKPYSAIMHMKGKMSNTDVRKWYIAQNNKIPDMIDKTKSIEEQAKQACELRNKHRFQARELMKDQETRKQLDKSDPNRPFVEIIEQKMKDKGLTYEEALKDVLKTATKTRKKVNKSLGLEE